MPTFVNRYARTSPGPWRPLGATYYLVNQGHRLGVPGVIPEHPRVKDNRQLSKIQGLTGEVCSNYFQPRQHDRDFTAHQIACARDTLTRCEAEVQKTHVIAAASVEMVDEAWRAFAMEPPSRSYTIVVAGEMPAPAPDHTDEIAMLRVDRDAQFQTANDYAGRLAMAEVEIARLKAENQSLLERLTRPAEPDPDHQRTHSPKRRTPAEA